MPRSDEVPVTGNAGAPVRIAEAIKDLERLGDRIVDELGARGVTLPDEAQEDLAQINRDLTRLEGTAQELETALAGLATAQQVADAQTACANADTRLTTIQNIINGLEEPPGTDPMDPDLPSLDGIRDDIADLRTDYNSLNGEVGNPGDAANAAGSIYARIAAKADATPTTLDLTGFISEADLLVILNRDVIARITPLENRARLALRTSQSALMRAHVHGILPVVSDIEEAPPVAFPNLGFITRIRRVVTAQAAGPAIQ